MLFYIFIPFILLFVRRFYFFAAALGLHVVSFFVETRWLSVGEFFLEYMVYFATGVLLYELISVRNKRVWLLKFIRKYTNLLIFLSFLFLLVSVPLGILKFTKFGYSFSMSATVMMMMWILYGRRSQLYLRVSNIIINKFSNFLGKISFSMYLVHVPILALMYATLSIVTNQLVYYNRIYWLAVVLIVPVSYLFYLVFEKSSLILLAKYKRKFKRRT
jgi:peptidoglycan/LPS O-acetylase OafA/YrhL